MATLIQFSAYELLLLSEILEAYRKRFFPDGPKRAIEVGADTRPWEDDEDEHRVLMALLARFGSYHDD